LYKYVRDDLLGSFGRSCVAAEALRSQASRRARLAPDTIHTGVEKGALSLNYDPQRLLLSLGRDADDHGRPSLRRNATGVEQHAQSRPYARGLGEAACQPHYVSLTGGGSEGRQIDLPEVGRGDGVL